MVQDPHADWPDRTPLYAEDGRLLLVFSASEHAYRGHRWADGVWRPDDVPVPEAAEASREAFAGWAVSTSDVGLESALMSHGATILRHAHTMMHRLDGIPVALPAPGLDIVSLDSAGLAANADAIGRLRFDAYPAEHPDHAHDSVDEAVAAMHRTAAGEVLGPLLGVSTMARLDGAVTGACLVVDREGPPPDGGPWILDVFRDPAAQIGGIGRGLLVGALEAARDAGLPGLSLVVSHANVNARRLYDKLGFVTISESRTLRLPDA